MVDSQLRGPKLPRYKVCKRIDTEKPNDPPKFVIYKRRRFLWWTYWDSYIKVENNDWLELVYDSPHVAQAVAKALEKNGTTIMDTDFEEIQSVSNDPYVRRLYMRKQALSVLELTKGFTGEPYNCMKSLLEMTDYVLELTNDL